MKIVYTDTFKHSVDVKEFTFPDGQVHAILSVDPDCHHARITARLRNGDDILRVLAANEALRHAGAEKVDLVITYLLGARMDRRIAAGQPFTLKVIAEMLRGKFDKITVLDPHSDVACALLDAEAVSSLIFVGDVLRDLGWQPSDDVALCAPDAGASKRVEDCARNFGGFKVVQCLKHRDSNTGELSGFRVANAEVLPAEVLIVDDICDGGRTFSSVAKLLKEAHGVKKVHLYVTHGIFSKGFSLEGVDKIYTTASYRPREEYPASICVVGNVQA